MDVASPANRRCVSKILGDPLDCTQDRSFALHLAVDARKFSQCERGQIGRGPCPEILGGYVSAGDLAEIGVDLCRTDGMALAGIVEILK